MKTSEKTAWTMVGVLSLTGLGVGLYFLLRKKPEGQASITGASAGARIGVAP